MSELRQRATARLREVALALAGLERERSEVASECARLGLSVADGKKSRRANPRGIGVEDSAKQVQAELRASLTDSARLRQEVARVVGFLDDLIGLLQEPSEPA